MNWRRGFVLAAINLAVAVPLVVSLELRDAAYVRNNYVPPKAVEPPPVEPSPAPDPKGGGVSFVGGPCMFYGFPRQEGVLFFTNFPAAFLTQSRVPCPNEWSLAGRLHAGFFNPTPASIAAQRKVDIALLLLIPLQWILVGGFPLRRPKRPWGEPGMFITICGVISAIVVFIHPGDGRPQLGPAIAELAWLWWFCLLVWTIIRPVWERIARRNIARAPDPPEAAFK
jgi:hypothetical protein